MWSKYNFLQKSVTEGQETLKIQVQCESNDGILDHDDNEDDYGQKHLQHCSEQKRSKDKDKDKIVMRKLKDNFTLNNALQTSSLAGWGEEEEGRGATGDRGISKYF